MLSSGKGFTRGISCFYHYECYNLGVKVDFDILDHTADIGIVAYGKDITEVFINAGKGLFSLIINSVEVSIKNTKMITVTAPDMEALLVNWLNELIYLLDTRYLLFKNFEVSKISETEIKAKAYGEKLDAKRHHLKREVKAATYHRLKIEKTTSGWQAQVIFDI